MLAGRGFAVRLGWEPRFGHLKPGRSDQTFFPRCTHLVLSAVHHGVDRNGRLLRRIAGTSQKALTRTLRDLEHNGLIRRTDDFEMPPRVEDALTETGESPFPVIESICTLTVDDADVVHIGRTQGRRSSRRGPGGSQYGQRRRGCFSILGAHLKRDTTVPRRRRTSGGTALRLYPMDLEMRKRSRSTPNGIRTRVSALKGRCPRPLDDGGTGGRATLPVNVRSICGPRIYVNGGFGTGVPSHRSPPGGSPHGSSGRSSPAPAVGGGSEPTIAPTSSFSRKDKYR